MSFRKRPPRIGFHPDEDYHPAIEKQELKREYTYVYSSGNLSLLGTLLRARKKKMMRCAC